ncbi:MAG: hypothetical protein JWR52_834 [Marmoricola sp.]|nr:hypothetical protein [Marmoricola sp.]
MARAYRRFVALGDSQTEGLNDGDDVTGFCGWADRLAEMLASSTSPDLAYANLAVRGYRSHHVLERQLPAALAMRPDLAVVSAGMNDLFRHNYDLDETVEQMETVYAALRATGCRVLTMTFPDLGQLLPVLSWLHTRQGKLNQGLIAAAQRQGVEVLELRGLALMGDPRMWSHDRIHGSSEGHARIAAGMAELMELPGSNHLWSQTEHPGLREPREVGLDLWWIATFVTPFLIRQMRGRGSGVGRLPKRPELVRVLPAPVRQLVPVGLSG